MAKKDACTHLSITKSYQNINTQKNTKTKQQRLKGENKTKYLCNFYYSIAILCNEIDIIYFLINNMLVSYYSGKKTAMLKSIKKTPPSARLTYSDTKTFHFDYYGLKGI